MRSAAVGGVRPVSRSITTSRPPRSTTEKRLGGGRSTNTELFLEREHRERGLRRFAALILALLVGARKRLFLILDGQYAIADREPVERQRHDAARAFVRHDLEMIGFAEDHDAQYDIGVIPPAVAGERNRRRHLERAGDGPRVMAMPRRSEEHTSEP